MRLPLRDLPRDVAVLSAVAFFVALGFGIVAPAIPVFATSFGVGNFAAGAVISVFALMRFVSAFGGGRLVNAFGERLILATGIGIVAVSSLLAGLSQNYTQLLVLRGVGGIGSAMFTVSAVSLLLRVSAPDQRGRASGAFQGGFLIGAIAGPAFGGPLTDISLRAPFFLYAGTLAAAGTVAMVFLARSELHEKDAAVDSAGVTPLREAFKDSAYIAALTNSFTNGWALFGLRVSLVPVFVIEGLEQGAVWTGVGLVLSALVQGVALIPAGRLADTRGRKPFMLLGALLITASMLLLATTNLTTYLIAMAAFGAGSAFIGTASAAAVGDVIHGRGGTAVAAYQMAGDAGTFIGPLVAGLLADEFSFSTAFLVSAAVAGIGAITVAFMHETRTASPTPAPTPRPGES